MPCIQDTMKAAIEIITAPCLHTIDADLQVSNCRKFKNYIGWEPEISFEQIRPYSVGSLAG